jgi:hypothetical protein
MFLSENLEISWICLKFTGVLFSFSGYALKSGIGAFPKSWKIEWLNQQNDWIQLEK